MITFIKLRCKNFLSTGNQFVEYDLNGKQSVLCYGANGSGKSLFLDAICFALFNKPFRSINKPLLLNSTNNGDCVVELEFSIGEKKYKVTRGIKPNILEILVDGKELSDTTNRDLQDVLEENIIKMNFRSFTQIVILGSASYTPFMELTSGNRKQFVEELLDIQIFSTMNRLCKIKMDTISRTIEQTKNNISILESELKAYQDAERKAKEKSKDLIEVNNKKISEYREKIAAQQKKVQALNQELSNISTKLEDYKQVQEDLEKLKEYEIKIESKLKSHKSNLSFFEDNAVCPKCAQPITEDHKQKNITELTRVGSELENGLEKLRNRIEAASTKYTEKKELSEKYSHLFMKLQPENFVVSSLESDILHLEHQNKNLVNTYFEVDQNKIKEVSDKIAELNSVLSTGSSDLGYLEVVEYFLRDTGIKTRIIKHYLPTINKFINYYLTIFDFYVNFSFDEMFSERFGLINRENHCYASFSEGEKFRINIAILMTWREIAKMRNNCNTNLLVLDEIFDSSLDGNGIEQFLTLMKQLEKDTNIIVISHRGDQMIDKFRSTMKVEKVNGFTRVTQN